MSKIAFVIQKYGREVIGKPEILCRSVEELLKDRHDIEIITTCAEDDSTWQNDDKPGCEQTNERCIRRFLIQRVDDRNTENILDFLIHNEHVYEDEIVWIQRQGPYCPELFDYIHKNYRNYHAVIFVSYLYYTTAMCMLGIPNALLMPLVHENTAIYLPHYQRVFREHNGFIFHFEEEKRQIENIFGTIDLPYIICETEKDSSILVQKLEKMIAGIPDFDDPTDIQKEKYEIHYEVGPFFGVDGIVIVFTADDRYAAVLCVGIQSVIENSCNDNNYDIVVLSDGISFKHQKEILSMVKGKRNIQIRFVEAGYRLDQCSFQINNLQLSRAAFLRLLLPDVMKGYDKVLYLDGDVIIMKDLKGLFQIELPEYLVAAVEDPYISTVRKYKTNVEKQDVDRYLQDHVGLSADERYFNSGVLLMNLKAFRQCYTVAYMLETAAEKKWRWEDQDVLNKLCRKKVLWLSRKWNVLWSQNQHIQDIMLTERTYFEAFHDAHIIHYAGGNIPIKFFGGLYAEEYWRTARKTPFYENLIRQSFLLAKPETGEAAEEAVYKTIWQRKISSARIHLKNNGLGYTCKILLYNIWGMCKYGVHNDMAIQGYIQSKIEKRGNKHAAD